MTKKGVIPEWFYQGSTVFKAFGFPTTNFGNDGGVDSRLKISGMTNLRKSHSHSHYLAFILRFA